MTRSQSRKVAATESTPAPVASNKGVSKARKTKPAAKEVTPAPASPTPTPASPAPAPASPASSSPAPVQLPIDPMEEIVVPEVIPTPLIDQEEPLVEEPVVQEPAEAPVVQESISVPEPMADDEVDEPMTEELPLADVESEQEPGFLTHDYPLPQAPFLTVEPAEVPLQVRNEDVEVAPVEVPREVTKDVETTPMEAPTERMDTEERRPQTPEEALAEAEEQVNAFLQNADMTNFENSVLRDLVDSATSPISSFDDEDTLMGISEDSAPTVLDLAMKRLAGAAGQMTPMELTIVTSIIDSISDANMLIAADLAGFNNASKDFSATLERLAQSTSKTEFKSAVKFLVANWESLGHQLPNTLLFQIVQQAKTLNAAKDAERCITTLCESVSELSTYLSAPSKFISSCLSTRPALSVDSPVSFLGCLNSPIRTTQPVKKVRLAAPLLREIEVRDLDNLDEVKRALVQCRKLVVVVGAGISTSGGIPDFRGAGGVYTKSKKSNMMDLFNANLVFRTEESRRDFYAFISKLSDQVEKAKPTPTHDFLKSLDSYGKLLRVYSQNIDYLESRAGLPTGIDKLSKVVPLHGSLQTVGCHLGNCPYSAPFTPEIREIFAKGESPHCPGCKDTNAFRIAAEKRPRRNGILRPQIVLYNEEHPQGHRITELVESDARRRPDLLLIMGTSLKIPGCKDLIKRIATVVHENGGLVIFVNETSVSSSEWESLIDVHVKSKTDDFSAAIAEGVAEYEKKREERKQKRTENGEAKIPKPSPIHED